MRTTSAHSPQVHRSRVRRTPIARTTAPTRRSTSRATAGASSSGCARYRSTDIRDAVDGQLARGRDARIRTTSGSARQGSAIAVAGGRGTSAATRGDESVACRRAHIPGRAPRTTSGAGSLMDGSVEPRAQLLALVRGSRISQAIYVVTQLGIPDLLWQRLLARPA